MSKLVAFIDGANNVVQSLPKDQLTVADMLIIESLKDSIVAFSAIVNEDVNPQDFKF